MRTFNLHLNKYNSEVSLQVSSDLSIGGPPSTRSPQASLFLDHRTRNVAHEQRDQ